MSIQERAQSHISQLDKEVSACSYLLLSAFDVYVTTQRSRKDTTDLSQSSTYPVANNVMF